jgi:hypothetical protein
LEIFSDMPGRYNPPVALIALYVVAAVAGAFIFRAVAPGVTDAVTLPVGAIIGGLATALVASVVIVKRSKGRRN